MIFHSYLEIHTMTFGDRLYTFYTTLRLESPLPSGIEAMNPYLRPETQACVRAFCDKYFADKKSNRVSVWGINPGRFGGGLTGLSFTDPVILREICGIQNTLGTKHELSAEYVWSVIAEYGGAERFFGDFFLTALCPLGFVKQKEASEINYNFYDDKALFQAVKSFMVETMQQQIAMGLRQDVAICFGTGKLHSAFEAINAEYSFFERILPLEHPRFIMQYRRKEIAQYRQKYMDVLSLVLGQS
ncbi:MAG: DUF4918 family protein [Ignavibacteria bacterium]|nr:DUF4918 family protein [Ignavibacteria bacterium]